MNPIGKITRAITHPLRTVGTVAGQAIGLAAAGARTTIRVIAWTTGHGTSAATTPPRPRDAADQRPGAAVHPSTPMSTAPSTSTRTAEAAPGTIPPATGAPKKPTTKRAPAKKAPSADAPAKKAPAKKAPAKKTPARKAPAKKAPSAQAATAGPALAMKAKNAGEDPALALASLDLAATGAGTAAAVEPEPGAEPLLDASTAKAIRTESEILQRASDPHKG